MLTKMGRLLAAGVAALCLLAPSLAQDASERGGVVREWLRDRKLKELREEPAPVASADTSARITKPGDYTFAIVVDGLTRMYRVHVPARYDPTQPTPLLISLHGGGANMDYQASEANYGQIGKADRAGFIVVFPNGFSRFRSGKLATWNAGACCADARDEKIDDVAFMRKMIATLSNQLNIDPKRVFATGMSNGGQLAFRLACEMPETIRAIASVAGTDNTTSCTPKVAIPVLHIHARNDDHSLFDGGSGPASRGARQVTQFTSVPATIARWVKFNGCTPPPRRVLEKPGAYCERYTGCRDNADVQLCVTEVGGHSWPGAEKTRGEPASTAISANDVMWEFFTAR